MISWNSRTVEFHTTRQTLKSVYISKFYFGQTAPNRIQAASTIFDILCQKRRKSRYRIMNEFF